MSGLYRPAIVSVAVLACSTGLAGAQPTKQSKDAQSSYEPRSGPGAGQKYLEAFVGEWDVVKTFYPRTGGDPSRSPGTCRQTMIHDGRFLQSEFVFEQAGARPRAWDSLASILSRADSLPSGPTRARPACRSARAAIRSMANRSSCSASRSRTVPKPRARGKARLRHGPSAKSRTTAGGSSIVSSTPAQTARNV